jgi:hypothetical protein
MARLVGEFGMSVIECELPPSSMLDRDLIARCYFHDSHRVRLSRTDLGMTDIFFGVFGHQPWWIKLMLVARNAVADLAGLEVPTVAEIMKPEVRGAYRVGEKIGPWPIFFIDENEIVTGRDNKHLDFRLSVLKAADGAASDIVVSTICTVHNLFGKIYLFFVVPLHRRGVRLLMSRAVAAKRL